jgi:hypothetical protein
MEAHAAISTKGKMGLVMAANPWETFITHADIKRALTHMFIQGTAPSSCFCARGSSWGESAKKLLTKSISLALPLLYMGSYKGLLKALSNREVPRRNVFAPRRMTEF